MAWIPIQLRLPDRTCRRYQNTRCRRTSRRPDHTPEEDNDNEDIIVLPEEVFVTNIIALPEEYFVSLIDKELQDEITSSPKYDEISAEAMKQLLSNSPKTMDPKYDLIPTSNGHLMTYDNESSYPKTPNSAGK